MFLMSSTGYLLSSDSWPQYILKFNMGSQTNLETWEPFTTMTPFRVQYITLICLELYMPLHLSRTQKKKRVSHGKEGWMDLTLKRWYVLCRKTIYRDDALSSPFWFLSKSESCLLSQAPNRFQIIERQVLRFITRFLKSTANPCQRFCGRSYDNISKHVLEQITIFCRDLVEKQSRSAAKASLIESSMAKEKTKSCCRYIDTKDGDMDTHFSGVCSATLVLCYSYERKWQCQAFHSSRGQVAALSVQAPTKQMLDFKNRSHRILQ